MSISIQKFCIYLTFSFSQNFKNIFYCQSNVCASKKNLSPDFHNLWKQCCWCSALIFFSFFGLSPNDVTNIMGVVQFNFERVSGWSSNVTHSLKWVGIIFEFVFLFSFTCIFSDYFFNIHSMYHKNFMFNVNTKIYKKEVIALEIIVPKCVCIREWHKLLFRLFTRVIKLLVQIDSICSILQIQFQIPIVL